MPKKKEKNKNKKNQTIYNEYPKCPNCGKDLLFIRKYKHKIKKIWMVEFICGEHSCPHVNLTIPLENIKFNLDEYKVENPSIAEGFTTRMKRIEQRISSVISKNTGNKLICKKCGAINPPDGKFCISCGNKLEN
ncbi:MAG: hypothetical protein ACTSWR_11985 [Candidatus Helarchaeota archaeon]